jgi:N6-adenosine-specific RNA methylase IME4
VQNRSPKSFPTSPKAAARAAHRKGCEGSSVAAANPGSGPKPIMSDIQFGPRTNWMFTCDSASHRILPAPYGPRERMNIQSTPLLADFAHKGARFRTILADPPWRFTNRTGKIAPEHQRLNRYKTLSTAEICSLPVDSMAQSTAHLYLWVPNALLPDGLEVMRSWGFQYKANIVWHKIRKDGGPDGRGVGFYFRNVTELLLFGVRGKNARTESPGRSQVNFIASRKREHSRKPDEQYQLIEACSPGPYLELFGRGTRRGWASWGDQANDSYRPTWVTYAHNSVTSER